MGGRRIADVVTALAAVLVAASGVLLFGELQVLRAARALEQEAAVIAAGGVPAIPEPEARWFTPARALLIDGLRLSRIAAVTPDPEVRSGLLDRAAQALNKAARARSKWGEARVGQAYISALRRGAHASETVRLLAESYRMAPILKGAARWRVATGLGAWSNLAPDAQRAVLDEAVWLSQQSFRDQQSVLGMARRSPAYLRFFLRWREFR
jgi:hypothetical protein